MIGILNGVRFSEIHIPRTGGTARKEALLAAGAVTLGNHVDHVTMASLARWFPGILRDGLIWTVRRNPAEIAVSLWAYLRRHGADNPHAVPEGMSFVEWWWAVVETHPRDFAELRNHLDWCLAPGQLDRGRLRILRYDHLAQEWPEICEALGVIAPLAENVNATGAGEHWREHFDGRTHFALMERFSRDRHALGWPEEWQF